MIKSKPFELVTQAPDEWSAWQFPTRQYQIKCCDCGLVHDFEFRAFAETKQVGSVFKAVELPWPIRVMYRAKRSRMKGKRK
jgi:hypothetical protein